MIPKTDKILVSTDFSEVANHAVPYAYSIAAPGGEVHLIHVIEHDNTPSPLIAHYSTDGLHVPEKREEVARNVEAKLLALVPKAAEEQKIKTIVAAVFHPHVGEGILQEITDRGADWVVVGSHGHTSLFDLLMGSVTEDVINGSPVPVLVVPHG